MAISKKSWLAVAREATPGTAITTPTLYVPTKSNLKAIQHFEYLDEERATRDANYDRVATTREGSVDLKGPFYPDADVYWLLGAFGSVTDSQPDATHAATVYKHTLALADIPPSLTVFKSYDAQAYHMAYACVEKLSLKWDAKGKLLEKDVSLKGLFPVADAGPFTPTFSTVKPFAGYKPTITLGGISSTDIDEVTLTFEQKLTMWYPSNGSPDFVTVYFGERKLSLDYTARFDNTTNYSKFLTAADDSFVFDVQGALITNSGPSGTPPNTPYNFELTLTLPVIGYDSMEHDLGKDNILIKAKATARPSASPLVSGYVQNTTTAYTV